MSNTIEKRLKLEINSSGIIMNMIKYKNLIYYLQREKKLRRIATISLLLSIVIQTATPSICLEMRIIMTNNKMTVRSPGIVLLQWDKINSREIKIF